MRHEFLSRQQGVSGFNLAHVDGVCDGCAIVRGKSLLDAVRKKEFMEAMTSARRGGEVMEYVLPDIPRICTRGGGVGCLHRVDALEKREDIWKTAGIAVGALVVRRFFSWRRAAFRWYSGYRA